MPGVDDFNESTNPTNRNTVYDSPGAPPGSSSETESHGFALPTPGFDPEQERAAMSEWYQQRGVVGVLAPADMAEESVEEEVRRKIADLERVRNGPVTEEERERITAKCIELREGGFIEGLKPILVGMKSVPIEYWNRLVDEHEKTIAVVAEKASNVQRKMAEKDSEIEDLKNTLERQELGEVETRSAALSEVQRLNDENAELKDKIEKGSQHEGEIKQTISDTQGGTDKKALTECQDQIVSIQKKLDAAEQHLQTSRNTASDYYNQVQTFRQQRQLGREREQACKDKVKRLEADLSVLEGEFSKLKAQNKDLQAAAAIKEDIFDPEGLKKQVSDLLSKRERLNARIHTLETELARKSRAPQGPDEPEAVQPQGGLEELKTQCAELKMSRDLYRDLWARGVAASNENLVEFWAAVENTSREIAQLHRGVETLSRALGLEENVVDPSKTLKNIQSLQLNLITLRYENMTTRLEAEQLRRQLASTLLPKTEDEMKLRLKIVDEEEVEKRVSSRTQTYRGHRRDILDHIFEARSAFQELADRNVDSRDAIDALVHQYLDPTALPLPKLAASGGR
ncbi:hypothetical protein F5Y19DRAFT_467512 [Xylariaceae sp. FL1651]|nr:hypothetical protein F5Y19DRAFT_467512 [Xylariaceae sp. FL1651]